MEAVVMALCSAGLMIGGVSGEAVAEIPSRVGGVLTAVAAWVRFIQGMVQKKEQKGTARKDLMKKGTGFFFSTLFMFFL